MRAAEESIADALRPQDPTKSLARLFGDGVDWRRATGVVHVTAIGARPRAAIAVGPTAPKSPTDRFVLGFARARADVIVTTGAILRAEPELVHRTAETRLEEAAWTRWRNETLGLRAAPILLVLTASGELDLAHPALAASPRTVVWTTKAGRARIGAPTGRIEVVVDVDLEGASGNARADVLSALSAAIRWLRTTAGAETIVLEAGPHATEGIYVADPRLDPRLERAVIAVDELLLSVYAGGVFSAVAGPELPGSGTLAAYFSSTEPRTGTWIHEASGPWIFERYRRD